MGCCAMNATQDLTEGPVQSAQLILKCCIALFVVLSLSLFASVPGSMRVGDVLRKKQQKDVDE